MPTAAFGLRARRQGLGMRVFGGRGHRRVQRRRGVLTELLFQFPHAGGQRVDGRLLTLDDRQQRTDNGLRRGRLPCNHLIRERFIQQAPDVANFSVLSWTNSKVRSNRGVNGYFVAWSRIRPKVAILGPIGSIGLVSFSRLSKQPDHCQPFIENQPPGALT